MRAKTADEARAAVKGNFTEFATALQDAISKHDLARHLKLSSDQVHTVHATVVDNFDSLVNAEHSTLRIYLKTAKCKLTTDSQATRSVKRCRDGEKAEEEPPKRKASKSAANRKVMLSEVQAMVDALVGRFECTVARLVDEIEYLRGRVPPAVPVPSIEGDASERSGGGGVNEEGDGVNEDGDDDDESESDESKSGDA